jgi:hypothetical protein
MSESKWIGRTEGDDRVICLTNSRIFSCPDAGAYVLDLFEDQIIANCNRYMIEVPSKTGEGKTYKFQWYCQYLLETPKESRIIAKNPEYEEIFFVRSLRSSLRNRHSSLKSYRRISRMIYYYVTKAIQSNFLKENQMISCSDLIKLIDFIRYSEQKTEQKDHLKMINSPQSFARHLRLNYDLYRRVLKIKFGKLYNEKQRIFRSSVSFCLVPEITLKDFITFDEEDSSAVKQIVNSHSIIRLEDRRVFSSVRNAHLITEIPLRYIIYSCKEDISSIQYGGLIQTFRFVIFKERVDGNWR